MLVWEIILHDKDRVGRRLRGRCLGLNLSRRRNRKWRTRQSRNLGADREIFEDKVPATSKSEQKTKSKQKTKTKTKGVGQLTETAKPAPESPRDPPGRPKAKPTIKLDKLDKATQKVFATLFFTPGQTSLPGEIPWVDLLRAMGSAGFASQKLYGSIWQFTPVGRDVERSIQFHEPHPGVKIRFEVARRMGRWLGRAYSWKEGIFNS